MTYEGGPLPPALEKNFNIEQKTTGEKLAENAKIVLDSIKKNPAIAGILGIALVGGVESSGVFDDALAKVGIGEADPDIVGSVNTGLTSLDEGLFHDEFGSSTIDIMGEDGNLTEVNRADASFGQKLGDWWENHSVVQDNLENAINWLEEKVLLVEDKADELGDTARETFLGTLSDEELETEIFERDTSKYFDSDNSTNLTPTKAIEVLEAKQKELIPEISFRGQEYSDYAKEIGTQRELVTYNKDNSTNLTMSHEQYEDLNTYNSLNTQITEPGASASQFGPQISALSVKLGELASFASYLRNGQ